VQDGPVAFVGKVHVLKAHFGRTLQGQGLGGGQVRHLALAVHQGEHLVQIGQALLDLAVEHTQKVQRDVELDHETVDHDQIAQRHAAIHHPLRGAPEHGDQRGRDDELLAGVEQAQGGLRLQARAAQALQALVVPAGFKGFVAEVFDRLVVEQRVNRLGVRRRVELVGLPAKLGPPLGDAHREEDVERQRGHRDPGKPGIELDGQNGQHQTHFDQRGHDAVERIRNQRLDAAHAALDVACHAAGLARQMKAQAQGMQVLKGLQCNGAGRALRGLGEHQLAQFGESRSRQSQAAIGQQKSHRHHQQGARIAWLQAHGVDQFLEQHGHAHIGQFGPHHESQRQQHAPLVFPEVRQKPLQGVPVTPLSGSCGRRSFATVAHEGQS